MDDAFLLARSVSGFKWISSKSKSPQNPSDPDAAYNSKKGRGYHVQIMETYTDTADQDVKKNTLNLITHVEVEKASKSDAKAIIPAIEKTKKENLNLKC